MGQRQSLAAWSAELHQIRGPLTARQSGPDVDSAHPAGWYAEDFEFVANSGDLDLYNGRFTVTPAFPRRTYADFVAIDEQPAFPYVIGRQYYGAAPPARGRVNAGRIDLFRSGQSSDPSLTSWLTKYNEESAHVVDAEKPEESSVVTWPGQEKPARADISEVVYSDEWVYVSGSGLASHTMGLWYDSDGSIFRNWPTDQDFQERFPRHPHAGQTKAVNVLGPVGRWVNGVALFNMLDGASGRMRARLT